MFYNFFSRLFGGVANLRLPFQSSINSWYVRHFGIDLSEFEGQNAKDYPTLNKLFTRRFRADVLQNKLAAAEFVSPCDGRVLSSGSSEGLKAFSIKGREYAIDELLGRAYEDLRAQSDAKIKFDFSNIYLSPSDYHHYHAPCDIEVCSLTYICGKLYSVAPKWLGKVASLYTQNERVVLKCRPAKSDKKGEFFYLVFVGATNVGRMCFDFEPRLKTNAGGQNACFEYEDLRLQKGAHIGNFELGSTIVLIAPSGMLTLCKQEGKVRFGEEFAKFN